MTISALEQLLQRVAGAQVWHRQAPEGEPVRIVWHQYGYTMVDGGNAPRLRLPQVQIDIYTQSEADTLAEDVMDALSEADQTYMVYDVSYDDEEHAIRTVLQLELDHG